MSDAYPMLFEPMLLEKVWGGRKLAGLGKSLDDGVNIGESWEIADLGSTAPSGAGGGARRSVIANGPLAGKTIHAAMSQWGTDLLGAALGDRAGRLPAPCQAARCTRASLGAGASFA